MPTKIKRVEEQIRTIFEEKMESGDMVPATGLVSFKNNKHCGCLIGMVHPSYRAALMPAATKLGITEDQANLLERGFELRKPDIYSDFSTADPYYRLGARIRRHYT